MTKSKGAPHKKHLGACAIFYRLEEKKKSGSSSLSSLPSMQFFKIIHINYHLKVFPQMFV